MGVNQFSEGFNFVFCVCARAKAFNDVVDAGGKSWF